MNQIRLFFACPLVVLCFVITNSCSQTTIPESASVLGVFKASTPCDDISKTNLEIPSGIKCELMKWNLTLYQDPKTLTPSDFKLIYVYGLPKQGTRDFMEGARTIELKGKWTIGKGTKDIADAVVYKLNPDSSQISLSFLKLDQNLLHLLDGDKRLMVGSGAWSFTLNKTNPNTTSSLTSQKTSSQHIATDSPTVGIFNGRTICNSVLREINGISPIGCQATKWRLTLYQDPNTHTPTTFQLKTVYVGKGDSSYTNTGKWVVTKGTKNDPEAVVYQLELDSDKPQRTLAFLKADDNILFFLDNERNLMVGDVDFSYALNRKKN